GGSRQNTPAPWPGCFLSTSWRFRRKGSQAAAAAVALLRTRPCRRLRMRRHLRPRHADCRRSRVPAGAEDLQLAVPHGQGKPAICAPAKTRPYNSAAARGDEMSTLRVGCVDLADLAILLTNFGT